MRSALLTGITGQDGSYLAELLLERGYTVHGMVRRSSLFNRSRIEHLRSDSGLYGKRLFLHYGDLEDATTLRRILIRIRPHELYHLAGQSQPGLSFEIPESTVREVGLATLSLLEMVRDLDEQPRMFLASSSEVFGNPVESVQDEETPFRPVNPYGCAKAFSTNLGRVYRQAHGLFVCNGLCYNHESPRRGESFVTSKIATAAARIAQGAPEVLELGNLDASRDWGYAPEYVEAMWSMLQVATADDYVVASGTSTSVREFAQAAFEAAGLPLVFEGEGIAETGRHSRTGEILIRVNPKYYRPIDPARLVGNSAKARRLLGWKSRTSGRAVAVAMVESARRESAR
ncbi:MAG: GDPmannose 4,6-dehydratase [Verrucomicrobia bacterium]|nr:MAG: GDPmannose 4,6-dehydratase [Verrucomicrobiota bacterium]